MLAKELTIAQWYLARVIRLFRLNFTHRIGPIYVVTEYPKSGGTWLCQMLADSLNVPFPRRATLPPLWGGSVIHAHYLFKPRGRKVVALFRDGRDVLTSWYYHCMFPNERDNRRLVQQERQRVPFEDYDNVVGNMPRFIEYVFAQQSFPRFSWAEFVRHWVAANVITVRYEGLRADTPGELGRVVELLNGTAPPRQDLVQTADKYSFRRVSGRQPGEERKNSFMRKGIVGDWKNHFTREASEVFDHYAGEELILLGYEEDHEWVKRDEIHI